MFPGEFEIRVWVLYDRCREGCVFLEFLSYLYSYLTLVLEVLNRGVQINRAHVLDKQYSRISHHEISGL